MLYPSQLLGGEAQRVDEEQEERRECKGEGWTEDAPAARRTHMNTRPGDEAVHGLTGWGEPKIVLGLSREGAINAVLDLGDLVALLVQPLRLQRNIHAEVSPRPVGVGKAIEVVLVPGVPVAAAVAHHPLQNLGDLLRHLIAPGGIPGKQGG